MTRAERITINPKQCGGKPCIRGMRIRVIDVLEGLANGMSESEVVKQLDLEIEDVRACFEFAAKCVNDLPRGMTSDV